MPLKEKNLPLIILIIVVGILLLQPPKNTEGFPTTLSIINGQIVTSDNPLFSFTKVTNQGVSTATFDSSYGCVAVGSPSIMYVHNVYNNAYIGQKCTNGQYVLFKFGTGSDAGTTLSTNNLINGHGAYLFTLLWKVNADDPKGAWPIPFNYYFYDDAFYYNYQCYTCTVNLPDDQEKGCLSKDGKSCVTNSDPQCNSNTKYDFEKNCLLHIVNPTPQPAPIITPTPVTCTPPKILNNGVCICPDGTHPNFETQGCDADTNTEVTVVEQPVVNLTVSPSQQISITSQFQFKGVLELWQGRVLEASLTKRDTPQPNLEAVTIDIIENQCDVERKLNQNPNWRNKEVGSIEGIQVLADKNKNYGYGGAEPFLLNTRFVFPAHEVGVYDIFVHVFDGYCTEETGRAENLLDSRYAGTVTVTGSAPPSYACTTDAECEPLGDNLVCNVKTGACENKGEGCTTDAECEEIDLNLYCAESGTCQSRITPPPNPPSVCVKDGITWTIGKGISDDCDFAKLMGTFILIIGSIMGLFLLTNIIRSMSGKKT